MTLKGEDGSVTLTCDSEYGGAQYGQGHDGAHHDPVFKIRWKVSGA